MSGERRTAIPQHPRVWRFLSGHSMDGGPPRGEAPPTVFLHIPKSGGTWLTDVVIHNLLTRECPDLFYAPHWMSAAEAVRRFGSDARLALVLRDPAERFASAWASRMAEGRPGYDTPWTEAEREVFGRYPDLPALLADAGSLWPARRARARRAVEAMTVVPRGYAHAFGSVEAARALLPAIRLCMPIGQLSARIGEAMAALGFATFELPETAEENRGAGASLAPGDRARLRRFLAEDYAVHELLRGRARELHGEV